MGTLGYMSPQQQAKALPAFADDLYGLGAIILFVLTGVDPTYVLFGEPDRRVAQLRELSRGAPHSLVEAAAVSLQSDPDARPRLAHIQEAFWHAMPRHSVCLKREGAATVARRSARHAAGLEIHRLLEGGIRGLLEIAPRDRETDVWLSAPIRIDDNASFVADFELRKSANRGVAGVVYLLGRLARFGYCSKDVPDRVRRAASWLLKERNEFEDGLPGLHFGRAGIAVAFAEAIAGGVLVATDDVTEFVSRAMVGKLDWPDITHGAAGQGLAAFCCADRLAQPRLLESAHAAAAYLIQTQKADGSWKMPEGADGMSGETLTGFAHGAAGIVYFLSEYARRFAHEHARDAANRAADWLAEQAIPARRGRALEWAYSDASRERWKWWCHGSPGIALAFLRLYEVDGLPRHADIARRALMVHPVHVRHSNLTQCHGLAGLGEIYLEAFRVLAEPRWFIRARAVAESLAQLRRENGSGAVTWLAENALRPTADLMVGSGGILHFLLRLEHKGHRMGFPMLMDPPAQ
jgi:hypothetical protein